MTMHNPPHPGEIVKMDCLEPLGLSVDQAAEGLGVTTRELSDIVSEKTGISAEMSVRLSNRLRKNGLQSGVGARLAALKSLIPALFGSQEVPAPL